MNYISGTAHDMMALIEIEEELKKHLEPAKQSRGLMSYLLL